MCFLHFIGHSQDVVVVNGTDVIVIVQDGTGVTDGQDSIIEEVCSVDDAIGVTGQVWVKLVSTKQNNMQTKVNAV